MITLEKKGVMTSKSCAANDAANVRISVRFELTGLRRKFRTQLVVHLCDTVVVDKYFDYERDAYAVDIYKADGTFIRSLYGETEAERNSAYVKWCSKEGNRTLSVQYVQYYIAPDGFVGTLENFQKWAEEGHLHGLTVNTK